ncbi:hypothetical protein J2W91_002297 [Paenibacillus amylolyticus]|uniref:Uncharacterized protein n=1 Tax=Paenibacillus amylolyticus TaxID=1451 RepID=A0AAP5H205_PAEAM|nr:hypothetical protein [Paenibacillus amylolyticus]
MIKIDRSCMKVEHDVIFLYPKRLFPDVCNLVNSLLFE